MERARIGSVGSEVLIATLFGSLVQKIECHVVPLCVPSKRRIAQGIEPRWSNRTHCAECAGSIWPRMVSLVDMIPIQAASTAQVPSRADIRRAVFAERAIERSFCGMFFAVRRSAFFSRVPRRVRGWICASECKRDARTNQPIAELGSTCLHSRALRPAQSYST
jgi:hypothetical protein